jgi:hypothetical protein
MESYTEAEFEKFFSSGTTPPPILELQAKAKLLLDTATADRRRKFKRGAVMCRRALALVEKYRKEETRGTYLHSAHAPIYYLSQARTTEAGLHMNLGNCLLVLGDHDGMITALKQAVKLDTTGQVEAGVRQMFPDGSGSVDLLRAVGLA